MKSNFVYSNSTGKVELLEDKLQIKQAFLGLMDTTEFQIPYRDIVKVEKDRGH